MSCWENGRNAKNSRTLRVCSKTMDYSCDFATRPTTGGRKGRAGFMNKTALIEEEASVGKSYRFACKVKNGEETATSYDLVFGENEQDARAKFFELQDLRLKFWRTHHPRGRLSDFRSTGRCQIQSVDEIDSATITERSEGAHLNAIPALRCLPRRSLVIRPADHACCESGWVHEVVWDGDGHELRLSVVGCRSYMEIPLRWPPFYVVESADGALGVCLCPQHLAENFPQWKKLRIAANHLLSDKRQQIDAGGNGSRTPPLHH
jgi:hypothetical protein